MRPTWVRLIILGDLEERCVIRGPLRGRRISFYGLCGVLALLEDTNEQDSTQKTDQLHDYLNRQSCR
jgi:hypothetical protein